MPAKLFLRPLTRGQIIETRKVGEPTKMARDFGCQVGSNPVILAVTTKDREILDDFQRRCETRAIMGRIFETRKATMFARWDRMAKAFTRVAKEIAIAVKAAGPMPENNPSLRRAIQNARSVNMPKDKIEAAIKRASGQADLNYQVVFYEGYAPHGVPVIVEGATDNPVRTVSNVRRIFKNGGGNLGAQGSVSFLFKHMGVFRLDPEGLNIDELEFEWIDHGLEEMGEGTGEKGEKIIIARCLFENFGKLQSAIEAQKLTPLSFGSEYIPENWVELPTEQANEVLELVDALEQEEDVQHVFHSLK